MEFQTTIELGGKTATGMRVPEEIVEALGSGKRPAVRVTLGGYTYRSTIAPMGGAFFIPVSAEVRAASGVKAGDDVAVSVEIDSEPRVVEMPDDLSAELEGDSAAKSFFESLSYSDKRRFVLQIEDAKTPETRQRRIVKTMEQLRNQKV
ncbi:MAG: YdeI/OmpD-associated family protein [Thermomicrobiales bacterium]